jgi:hypothetical protein
MAKITRLSSEQRDNLAAYLDGELDEHATQEIEQVLAVSEVARHEIDMLSRTWDMLNVLPTYKAADDFTHKTITSLRAAEQAGPGAAAVDLVYRNARRGVVLTAWIGVLSVCAYVGFMATNHWVPNESEQLLQDYDIINNLDQYSEVVNRQTGGSPVEFLEILKSRRTLSEHDEPSEK